MDVFIIETDQALAERLGSTLEERGIAPRIFADGEQALAAARDRPPAAVVLALELGDKPSAGFSWCNRFKRDDGLRHIPLVLTSGLASAETFAHHQRLRTRADAYLHKPFTPESLLDSLRTWLPLDAPPAGSDEDLAVELLGEADIETIDEAELEPVDGLDEFFFDLAESPETAPPPAAEPTVFERPLAGRPQEDQAVQPEEVTAIEVDALPIEDEVPPPERTVREVITPPSEEAFVETAGPDGAAANAEPTLVERHRAEDGEDEAPAAREERLSDESSDLRAALSELERRVADQGAELAAARGEAAALQDRLHEVEAELETVRSERDAAGGTLEQERSDLEAARGEVESVRAELEAARGETESVRAELEAARGETESVRAELEAARAEGESVRTELAEARREADELRQHLADREASLEANETALQAARAEAADRAAQVARMREEWERTSAELEQSSSILDQLRDELGQANADLEARTQEVADARAAGERLATEMHQAQTEAQRLQGELEAAQAAAGEQSEELSQVKKQVERLAAELEQALAGRAEAESLALARREHLEQLASLVRAALDEA